MDMNQIKKYLQENLSKQRCLHTFGVADEAVRLAKRYGADEDSAYIAGLLHDCAKEIPADEALHILRNEFRIEPNAMMLKEPRLLHGTLGACITQSVFDIYDTDILDAIKYHTTGKANMCLLGKIIYIADYIEPNRTYHGVEELRKLAYRDLDAAIIFGIDFTITDLIKRGMVIQPDTLHCRNYLLMQREGVEQEPKI